jgi:hypothetical protein
VAFCNIMSSETKPERKAFRPFLAEPPPGRLPSITDRIADFLDGRTHGEDLLHELYDHVLEEPIPQSMRALLKETEQGDQKS